MGSLYARIAGPLRQDTAIPNNIALFPRAVLSEAGPAITEFGNFLPAGELRAGIPAARAPEGMAGSRKTFG